MRAPVAVGAPKPREDLELRRSLPLGPAITAGNRAGRRPQPVVPGEGEDADRLLRAANRVFGFNMATLKLAPDETVAQNVPPALAETIAGFVSTARSHAIALVCSGFKCQAPVSDPGQLTLMLRESRTAHTTQ